MIKRIKFATVILIAFTFSTSLVHAEGSEKSLDLSLNVTQASYSDSWTGGEVGNVTWVALANGIFTDQLNPTITLRNTAKLAFGQTVTQDKETKVWSKPAKSTDKIDLESMALFDLHTFVEPYAAIHFESQFLDASIDSVKRYLNPITLTESAGIAKQILKKDKNDIISRLGLAIKENLYRNIDPATGETVSESATDGGFESITDIKLSFNDKLGYLGKLSLYKALFFSKKNDFDNDYWKQIDVNFENTVTASITKYVQVSMYVQLLYDKQIIDKGRIKETLGLGLTYKMF